jgi:hypothetical protein
MATSGTSDFTLDIIDICEEAYERAGMEMRGGYELKTARRSLDLMSLEWINRGVNLWTIEEGTLALTAGTATYGFPAGTIDFIEHHIRTNAGSTSNQSDSNLTRISPSTFASIPNKLTSGKPLQISKGLVLHSLPCGLSQIAPKHIPWLSLELREFKMLGPREPIITMRQSAGCLL